MSHSRKDTEQPATVDGTAVDWAHSNWPLGKDHHDISTTEFEWAVMRFFSAFERSCLQLSVTAGARELSFQELVLLHVVAMQHHPQTSQSIARQLNRDDIQNLQYAIRKLEKRELIAKSICGAIQNRPLRYNRFRTRSSWTLRTDQSTTFNGQNRVSERSRRKTERGDAVALSINRHL